MGRFFAPLILCLVFTVSVLSRSAAGENTAALKQPFVIQFKNPSAIFPPQTPVLIDITPVFGEGTHLTVSVFRAADIEESSPNNRHKPPKIPLTELKIQITPQNLPTPIPVSFLAPQEEGCYIVSVKTVSERFGMIQYPFQRRAEESLVEIAVKFIVLDPKPVQRPIGEITPLLQHDLLESEGTTGSLWRKRISSPVFPKVGNISVPKLTELPKWSNFRERPLTRVQTESENPHESAEHLLSGVMPEITEETLPLPVKETGKLHLLEVEYFTGVPRKQEIRIEEPEAPSFLSGIYTAEEIAAEPPSERTAIHRVFFCPKTKQTEVHFVNQVPQRYAEQEKVRKVRLYQIEKDSSGAESLLPKPFAEKPQRRILGYLHHPDDWKRFTVSDSLEFAGSKRFVELLQLGGYSGTMVGVLSGDCALYPSAQVQNTAEKKPVDSLELLAQLFDREDLTLIPAVDFNMPLPAVEQLLHENPAMSSELLWDVYVSPENGTVLNKSCKYNLFHPAVQNAMLGVVQELLQRYSKHLSFGGVAVQLNPGGYAQLPLFLNTIDSRTFQEFRDSAQKNGTVFPADTEQRDAAAKARLIQSEPKIRDAWFRWRTQKVCDFYHHLAKTVVEYRPDAKFYLTGSAMLDSPELRNYASPGLPRRIQLIQLIRMLGIDPALLMELPACVFLRPCCVPSRFDSLKAAVYQEFDSAEAGGYFVRNGMNPGTLFDHEEDSTVPAEHRNRRRFIRQLTQSDTESFFDGGSFVPLGEEQFLYDFIASFRQLPPVPFQTFQQPGQKDSLQPVTVRYRNTSEQILIYLVNDAPFGVTATLTFSAVSGASLTELSGRRALEPMTNDTWTVLLQPYDFIAVSLNAPKASIRNVSVHKPAAICSQGGLLEQKVFQLAQRIYSAQSGVAWDKLENPGFELSAENDDVPRWTCAVPMSARLDSEVKYGGNHSLKLSRSLGTENEPPGFIRSNSFELPPTEKLYLSLYLGIPEGTAPPPLEAVIAGETPACVRLFESKILTDIRMNPPSPEAGNAVRWHRVLVAFDKIPPESKSNFLGFRLLEPGTVWIDDVSLYQFAVNSAELKELQRILLAAGERQRADRVSDLLAILESYWVQFLYKYVPVPAEHVPVLTAQTAPKIAAKSGGISAQKPKEPAKKKEDPGFFDRFKNWIPFAK